MEEQLQLTFGVELEFVVVYKSGIFNTFHPELRGAPGSKLAGFGEFDTTDEGDVTPAQVIELALEQAGIAAIREDVPKYELNGHQSNVPTNTMATWTVSKDWCGLTADEEVEMPNGCLETTVELSSRVFGFDDHDFQHELRRVLDVLEKIKQKYACEIFTNESTGLHVHVGRRYAQDLPLAVCKRVFQLVTAHERTIEPLHMASRVQAPLSKEKFTIQSKLYVPPSCIHRNNSDDHDDANVFEWLTRIEDIETREQLIEMFSITLDKQPHNSKYSAYNFANLGNSKNTIEFRQHVGTLDLPEICAWVSLLCRLVNYCHKTPDPEFLTLLCRATDFGFETVDFLVALGVHDDVLMHYNRAGGEALLGFLPQTSRHYHNEGFDNLVAQNDYEQLRNASSAAVDSIIARKCEPWAASGVGYNGLIHDAGTVPFTDSVQLLLAKAYEHAECGVHSEHPRVADVGCLMSDARAQLYAKMALIYSVQHPDAGMTQRAVRYYLGDWLAA